MPDKRIRAILKGAAEELERASSLQDLEQLRVRYLGKKGLLTQLLRALPTLPPAERPVIGREANEAKAEIEAALARRLEVVGQGERRARLAADRVDLTLPGRRVVRGARHPLSLVLDEIIDVFVGLGFAVADGPEVESDYYNFEALNIPKDHPARDMQDTFYVSEDVLLRTHTSPVQIRTMLRQKPPVRIIVPGRVYRRDALDQTHSPVFHQVEGLAVDRDISMGDLRGTLELFARELFGADSRIRFRPSFFPFTEPSAEVDVLCFGCKGAGCRICKASGWLEILGSGMVHPQVLRTVGYDPEEVTGWAFGMGVERVAMLRYGIDDIRLFYDNDLRFLEQFSWKIPLGWLRELVETDATVEQIAARLTMAGIEVAGVTPVASGLSGVVIGEITAVAAHPAGGALTVCQVATDGEPVAVVCGAPNVRAGARAAFAPPGAVLPGGRRIEAAAIRGVLSRGMLCSEAELGIGEDAGTILLLDATAVPGADLVAHLGLDDVVLEVEITPNRPDCLSVLGIAREVAALTRGRLVPPAATLAELDPPADTLGSVTIDDPDLCRRFTARVITGVTVGPSPAWLARRLRAAGLRPINNVVDVTNYVMWELGHPLHAFDHTRLAGQRIVVRRARAGEPLLTLDGQARTLGDAMLVIADAERAVGVAGVMGGANTEVGPATRTVLLEAAYFKPGSIRRTARALGLSTEASYRFERGADVDGIPAVQARAAALIAELAGGRVARGLIDLYPAPRPPIELSLRLDRIRRVIGACPPAPVVGEILQSLGFPARAQAGGFAVSVPSFRRDVSLEDDLVEEVVRVWGYGEIQSTLPSGTLALTRRPRPVVAQDAVRQALTAAGFHEAVTISLINPAHLSHVGLAADDARVVTLQNPLAADRSVLRPTLLLGLLESIQTNVRRQMPDVRLFEIGRVYESQGAGKLALEETRIAIAAIGLRAPRSWFSGKARGDAHDVKGAVETLVEALGRGDVTVDVTDAPYLEEGRGATVVVAGAPVGVVGEVHPAVQRAFDLPAPVFFAEVSLDRLEALPARQVAHRPLPRFPAVQRDLAVVLPAGVPAADVEWAIRAIANPHLKRVTLFDLYTGEQVGAGRKSLAYALLYQADDRTLTDAEVNSMHGEVVERLRQALGAEVRGATGGESGA